MFLFWFDFFVCLNLAVPGPAPHLQVVITGTWFLRQGSSLWQLELFTCRPISILQHPTQHQAAPRGFPIAQTLSYWLILGTSLVRGAPKEILRLYLLVESNFRLGGQGCYAAGSQQMSQSHAVDKFLFGRAAAEQELKYIRVGMWHFPQPVALKPLQQ